MFTFSDQMAGEMERFEMAGEMERWAAQWGEAALSSSGSWESRRATGESLGRTETMIKSFSGW